MLKDQNQHCQVLTEPDRVKQEKRMGKIRKSRIENEISATHQHQRHVPRNP